MQKQAAGVLHLAAQEDFQATPPISQRLDKDRLALATKGYNGKNWQDTLKQLSEIQDSSVLASASDLRTRIAADAFKVGSDAYLKGKYLEARDDFSAAAAAGSPEAMLRLADLLSGRDRGTVQWSDEAEKWYLQALAAQPADVNVMLELAELYRRGNRIDAAVAMYKRAASLKSVPARLALAELAPTNDQARPLYQAVLDLDGTNAKAIKWMKDHPLPLPPAPQPATPHPAPQPPAPMPRPRIIPS